MLLLRNPPPGLRSDTPYSPDKNDGKQNDREKNYRKNDGKFSISEKNDGNIQLFTENGGNSSTCVENLSAKKNNSKFQELVKMVSLWFSIIKKTDPKIDHVS